MGGKQYLKMYKDGQYNQPLFADAILKYGWDSFEHNILYTGLTKLDVDMIEQDLIYYYKKEGLSYNIAKGGEGCVIKRFTDEELKEHKKQWSKRWYDKQRWANMDPEKKFINCLRHRKAYKELPEEERAAWIQQQVASWKESRL